MFEELVEDILRAMTDSQQSGHTEEDWEVNSPFEGVILISSSVEGPNSLRRYKMEGGQVIAFDDVSYGEVLNSKKSIYGELESHQTLRLAFSLAERRLPILA